MKENVENKSHYPYPSRQWCAGPVAMATDRGGALPKPGTKEGVREIFKGLKL